jgi:hypothetical protein
MGSEAPAPRGFETESLWDSTHSMLDLFLQQFDFIRREVEQGYPKAW